VVLPLWEFIIPEQSDHKKKIWIFSSLEKILKFSTHQISTILKIPEHSDHKKKIRDFYKFGKNPEILLSPNFNHTVLWF
jgi:hypothetical protein